MRFSVSLPLTLLLSLGGAALSFAQPGTIPTEAQAVAKTVRPEAIRAAMRFLADDALEGRKPGTRGFALAANYVQTQLEALGLQPAGENNTYRQAVPLRRWQVREKTSSLTLSNKGNNQLLTYGKQFILNPNPDHADSDVNAPVVFVGYGVSAPELGYDDYANIDVKGKIVAYVNGAPTTFPSNQRAYYSSAKAEMAAAHGAVGVLSFSLPTDLRNRIETAAPRARQGIYRWLDKRGKPQRTFPSLKGSASLSDSAARLIFANAATSFADAVAAALKNRPQAFPLNISVRMRTQTDVVEDVAGQNVVAVLPGSDPILKNEYIVYVAHLDHLGIGRPVNGASTPGDSIYNGAHDNASGVAINLETARLFAALPKAPRRSIVFVGVTGEEMGLLGSDYFASNPTVPKEKIVANFCLDMPFFFHPLLDIVPYGAEHSSLGRETKLAADFVGVQISPDPIPEQTVFMRSDHFSFVRQGIPAIYIKSGSQTGNPKLDGTKLNLDWRATIYHSPQDDINQPFDFNAAAKHVQLQFLIGYLAAQADSRPTWNKGDFFGTKFGQTSVVK
ncbi:M28 family metallopeptidase [Spirosoma sp. RP8]|uniref:M28 family metallopeptidase n=1 Tax=Spirosoma liriopis TaxID=2937440 RepID=A0ABT0HKJ1_9BACT|nr:M28 family metallopeptidase [Spirosoma liriopis]MCK8492663.1 M28 family metallopeptidase [Spirosoma liriopis]